MDEARIYSSIFFTVWDLNLFWITGIMRYTTEIIPLIWYFGHNVPFYLRNKIFLIAAVLAQTTSYVWMYAKCMHRKSTLLTPLLLVEWILNQLVCTDKSLQWRHSERDVRKLQSSASLAFVKGIHRLPVDHKRPVTRNILFDDIILFIQTYFYIGFRDIYTTKLLKLYALCT